MMSMNDRLSAALAGRYRIERFVQEIATTDVLQHPHILPLFDSGEADGFGIRGRNLNRGGASEARHVTPRHQPECAADGVCRPSAPPCPRRASSAEPR